MKPKVNRKGDPTQSLTMDRCETPAYALDPLLPYLHYAIVWEPACGSGRLVRALEEAGHRVLASDILRYPTDNFFTYCPRLESWDVLVTNPPYSIKPEWIERCYEIDKPFALLVPVETIGTGKVQRMMERHGAELLLLDKRVNFHMPNKGDAGSAQFPVLWYCWHLLPQPIVYGRITRRKDEQMQLFEVPA